MRLAAKLVLLFLVGLLLIVGLFSYLTIQQDRRLAMAEHQRYASDLAATLQPSIREAMKGNDQREPQQSITRSTRQVRHVRVRWVDLTASGDGSRQPAVPLDMIVSKTQVTTISMPDPTGQEVLVHLRACRRRDTAATTRRRKHRSLGSRRRSDRTPSAIHLVLDPGHCWAWQLCRASSFGLAAFVMVGKPLNQLIDKVHRVGQGDFSGPVHLTSADELGRLGVALNDMCDQLVQQRQQLESETASRIATLEQLRHSDRLNTVGRMAAGIAHEIGTPLNVVSGRAELIAEGQLSDEATRESAQAIKSEAQRIAKIIRELLDFLAANHPSSELARASTTSPRCTANLMRPLATKHGVEIGLHLPAEPRRGGRCGPNPTGSDQPDRQRDSIDRTRRVESQSP